MATIDSTSLDTLPNLFQMSTGEQVPINIDMSNSLLVGESVQNSPVPTAVVLDPDTGFTIPGAVSGTPAVAGNVVQVNLVGSAMRANHDYILRVGYHTSGTKILNTLTNIQVVI